MKLRTRTALMLAVLMSLLLTAASNSDARTVATGNVKTQILRAFDTAGAPLPAECAAAWTDHYPQDGPWALVIVDRDTGPCDGQQTGGAGFLHFTDGRWRSVQQFDEPSCQGGLSDVPIEVQSDLLGCGARHPHPAATAKVYVDDTPALETSLAQRPSSLSLVADGTYLIKHISWSRWGSDQSSATGLFVVSQNPSFKVLGTYPVRLTASDPKTVHGRRVYIRLSIAMPRRFRTRPSDFPRTLKYTLTPSGDRSNWR